MASLFRKIGRDRGNPLLQLVDRWVGIPIIQLFRIFRWRKAPAPTHLHSVGLLIPAGIGDAVLSLGVFQEIKRQFPLAEIVVFLGPSNRGAHSFFRGATVEILAIKNVMASMRKIRRYSFDAWIDFGQWARWNSFMSYAAKSRFKVGFKTTGQFRHYLYDRAVPHQEDRHEYDNFYELLQAFPFISTKSFPHIPIARKSERKKPFIICHLQGGGRKSYLKHWPLDSWKELISQLRESGYQVWISGGAAERAGHEEWIRTSFPRKKAPRCVAGTYTLQQMAAHCLAASAVITIDTGIMHIAAAAGARVVALMGPTVPHRWGGVGPHVQFVTPQMIYSPCLRKGFEKGCRKGFCMKQIAPSQVLQALNRVLK